MSALHLETPFEEPNTKENGLSNLDKDDYNLIDEIKEEISVKDEVEEEIEMFFETNQNAEENNSNELKKLEALVKILQGENNVLKLENSELIKNNERSTIRAKEKCVLQKTNEALREKIVQLEINIKALTEKCTCSIPKVLIAKRRKFKKKPKKITTKKIKPKIISDNNKNVLKLQEQDQVAESTHTDDLDNISTISDTDNTLPFEFPAETEIESEQKTHEHKCDICRETVDSAHELTVHRCAHADDLNYTCLICHKTYDVIATLKNHVLQFHKNASKYECDVCNKHFSRSWEFKRHLRIHDPEFICPTCKKQFTDRRLFMRHLRIHTPERKRNEVGKIDPNRPFQCDICHKRFGLKSGLTRHIYNHSFGRSYKCEHCPKQCTSYKDLTTHTRIHTGEKPYECDSCKKRFSQKSALNTHKRIHSGEKPYLCHICDRQFRVPASLHLHLRKHTGEKPFECEICHKRFTQKNVLVAHMRTHTGERPFLCNNCHKQFTTPGALITHQRVHTGDKPYECDICHKRFGIFQSMTIHKRIHTGEKPYECDICHKCFSQGSARNTHRRTHTGEKPYECDICSKSFSTKGNLTEHKLIHTGDMPFECSVCLNRFSNKRKYAQHKRKHGNTVNNEDKSLKL